MRLSTKGKGSVLRPIWIPLFYEGGDAFFCVPVQHIFHHNLAGIGIGFLKRHLYLLIIGSFASFHRIGQLARNHLGQ